MRRETARDRDRDKKQTIFVVCVSSPSARQRQQAGDKSLGLHHYRQRQQAGDKPLGLHHSTRCKLLGLHNLLIFLCQAPRRRQSRGLCKLLALIMFLKFNFFFNIFNGQARVEDRGGRRQAARVASA